MDYTQCPKCYSTKLIKYGMRKCKIDGKVKERQQYQCQECLYITVKPLVGPLRDKTGKFAKKQETVQNQPVDPQKAWGE